VQLHTKKIIFTNGTCESRKTTFNKHYF